MRRGKRMLEELNEDIRDHIERETQDNIERGMSPEEARYAALRKFGNVARVKEVTAKNLKAEYLVKADADATIAEAERSSIGTTKVSKR